MGYKVHSVMSVSSADGHEYFVYYLPAAKIASLWLNNWINSNFDLLASKLGPKAVLITAASGQEDSFRHSAHEIEDNLSESLRPVGGHREEAVLHEGAPMLLVTRAPLRIDLPADTVECAAINLSAYGEGELAALFDHLIEAIEEERDPLEGIPVALIDGRKDDVYRYSEALELKPNIFGLGVNGNAIIRLLQQWREKNSRGPA